MLIVFDYNVNIVELVLFFIINYVEGIIFDSIINLNVKDIVFEEVYESVCYNMDKVIYIGKSLIVEYLLMLDGVFYYYENCIFLLDDQYLLCMCCDVLQEIEMVKINEIQ